MLITLIILIVIVTLLTTNTINSILLKNKIIKDLNHKTFTIKNLNDQIEKLIKETFILKQDKAILNKQIELENKTFLDKLELLKDSKENIKYHFEQIANKIFYEKEQTFTYQYKNNIKDLLEPVQNEILSFKQHVNTIYLNDIKDRASLQKEVNKLFELNQSMNEEAKNLTQALKGDNKLQGDWGEVVLERVLESSGLRKNYEYKLQSSFKQESNNEKKIFLRPDVVIYLPDDKNIIIDAKVSILNYTKYIQASSEKDRLFYLKKHIESIKKHVDLLSNKNYEKLMNINSLDFILMFMPIEASLVVAFQYDSLLFHESFKKKIIIVTPTTLLATLATINNTWKYKNLNKNAKEITERASKMLDKFRGFTEDIDDLGKQINKSQELYVNIIKKLSEGKGNLISQALKLQKMGVSMKKRLPKINATIRK